MQQDRFSRQPIDYFQKIYIKNMSELVKRVYEKTLAHDVSEVKFEEIPAKLSKIFAKCLNKKVNVSGNGITDEMKIEI